MNLSKPLQSVSRLFHIAFLRLRFYLPKQRCTKFLGTSSLSKSGLGSIFVINLDRQPDRWADMVRELNHVLDESGLPLSERLVQYSACDARLEPKEMFNKATVDPIYTLSDQLFVEPQPLAIPDEFDLKRSIEMSNAEIAVACSHIGIWKSIAASTEPYAMILEDDVWFHRDFGGVLDQAWSEMEEIDQGAPKFDILYISYEEVRGGAPKELLSRNVFRPERGLWFLSGYILSKQGAQALLNLLPCQGPVDLWINHKFQELEVRALRRSLVNQRRDLHSTNSYSILPVLSRIGILDDGDAELFHRRPIHSPVFGFGPPGSGLSSLAMALSMLGYRCCNDFNTLPKSEIENLLAGNHKRIFDAYVNIGSLSENIKQLRQTYPDAKFIIIDRSELNCDESFSSLFDILKGADVLNLDTHNKNNWLAICEYLELAPPTSKFPSIPDNGQRKVQPAQCSSKTSVSVKQLRHDPSPWVASPLKEWEGISVDKAFNIRKRASPHEHFEDNFYKISSARWDLRTDTFPGSLGLFRRSNIMPATGGGVSLLVHEEALGVRDFSAGAITSRAEFLYGRFEATLKATNIPGLVTGFFLHRNTPRQEIDIEIMGNRPDRLLVNVFYNPGVPGTKYDYGYRGTPTIIELGFDASEAPHRYTIEWNPCEIRWFVDEKLVYRRAIWEPTPIPDQPMTLHVNTWPPRSQELAGKLALRKLPGSTILNRVSVESYM